MESYDQRAYYLASAHDNSYALVIADTENDASSISFYSCSLSYSKSEDLHHFLHIRNFARHCVRVFIGVDGKPFTINKQWKVFIQSM